MVRAPTHSSNNLHVNYKYFTFDLQKLLTANAHLKFVDSR